MHEVGGAEKQLLQMARAAAEARDDKALPRALGRLSMVYNLGEQNEKAVSMAQAAELAARRGGDDESLAYAQISAFNALQSLGRLEEAQATYQAATTTMERFERTAEPARLIYPLVHLGMATYLRGRYIETHEVFARVLRMHLDIHGMDNQRTPELMRENAILISKVGNLGQALDLARRGTGYFEKRGAAGFSDNVLLLIDVTSYLRQMGRLDEAEAQLARIRPLAEAEVKPLVRANFLQIEADVLLARRRYREAEESLRRARAAGALSMDNVGVALLVRTARALAGQGRRREARAQFAEAVALATRVLPPDHPATSSARVAAAAMEVEESDRSCEKALPTATAAVAALEPRVGKHSALLVEPLIVQGRCLVVGKQPGQAVPVLERALEVAARTGIDPEQSAVAKQWLARTAPAPR
jgi:tetratricopeptide (TPR) repeat protein